MKLGEAAFTLKMATLRRGTGRFYRELLDNARLTPEDLQSLQAERASRIARHAASTTRFYSQMFDRHAINLSELHKPEEWRRIPVLTRSTIKENSADLRSSEWSEKTARSAKTGGSTGEPLRTYVDARVPLLAAAWRMYGWWGVAPWDNLARVGRWGFGRADALKNAITWWPSRQDYLDAMLFDEDSMRAFHSRLQRTRPVLLEGYVGAMVELAGFLSAEGLTIPSLRGIATTAAPLTPNVRKLLEDVYGVPVYDEYRGSEINWMAGECREQNGLHQFADLRRIEILDDDDNPVPAGTVGNIVVTDLVNRVFPMIRYRAGDRGALLERTCACGVTLPLMAQPDGRTTDIIRMPSGKILNHGMMAMFGDHPESVRIFQLHQHSDHSITLRIVRGDDPDAELHIGAALQRLRERISDEVPVTVDYVSELPYTGGKTKYIISDLSG